MTRWMVTGAGGMLGRDLLDVLRTSSEDVVGHDRAGLDITDASAVADAVAEARAEIVVNCAAWTDVDGAETDETAALTINGDGAANVAEACRAYSARMIQVSTDYVFRGDATVPYAEDAPTDPINAYGRTKLAGELAVLHTLPATGYVVRTAWLYGAHGGNFVATMLRLEQQRETVDVVTDQVGQPTWTVDLARQLQSLGRSDAPPGVYHGTSSGRTSWHGLTQEIYRLIGADPARVRATTAAAFARPAARPAFSVLGHARWTAAGLSPVRPWNEGLAAALPHLLARSG